MDNAHTHTHTHCPLSWTTWVGRYQKRYSPTHTWNHYLSFISLLLLPQFIASSLLKPRALQSLCTTSWSEPSTTYFIHFFIQSVFFCNTCPYYHSLFCCSIETISPISSLSQLFIWNTIFEFNATHPSTCWSTISFSFIIDDLDNDIKLVAARKWSRAFSF